MVPRRCCLKASPGGLLERSMVDSKANSQNVTRVPLMALRQTQESGIKESVSWGTQRTQEVPYEAVDVQMQSMALRGPDGEPQPGLESQGRAASMPRPAAETQHPAVLQGQAHPRERGPQAAGRSADRSGAGPKSGGSPLPLPQRSSVSTPVTALGAGSPHSPNPPSAATPRHQQLGRSQDPQDRVVVQ
ncbi:voltage-dependent N-type calcium channel subunit alpha-1B-like isoform X2 [Eumetopias jubatus]|uniref:voltage-dependent N-type calcium channel subunit alpha-1B-like isoform X2 n=1 Tax=Eumetopias jubatus TaxID=34886 RepID=UPI0010168EB1|nr:voltage-dependent N-type calcium channel subunit alpha-1B-like isoform X2 [Eumetopias jubatus]